MDFRATKADPRDPAIAPDMKPMLQHEYVTGVDWAVTPNWSVETRYSRKRLDRTIEDMSITDNLGFYIGNPGSPVRRPAASSRRSFPASPRLGLAARRCRWELPEHHAVLRRVPAGGSRPSAATTALEISLAKRATGKWFGKLTYTYSKLTGNYPGLTNTDPTDGGTSGRLAPNNSRLFDLPDHDLSAQRQDR